jgi:hypothetical protein
MTMEHPVNRRWNMRQRDWAVVFWIAFLSAAAGSFVLFGLVNPLDMVSQWADKYDIGVRLAYGLAFAFLYLVCLLASALTMFMIRTGPSRGHARGKGGQPIPKVKDPSRSNPDLDDENWQ